MQTIKIIETQYKEDLMEIIDLCSITKLSTLAAPVLLGMMLKEAALPPLQSLLDGPSTVFCVAELQIIREETNNQFSIHFSEYR